MEDIKYSVYGTFEVTTEGDAEGRSTKSLGIYTGYIDEIAFALADKCYYSLSFSPIVATKMNYIPKKDKVKISLDANRELYNMNLQKTKAYFEELFKDRDTEVIEACGYGSCIISTHKETIEEKRAKILSKLTDEEKSILGLD